MAIMPRATDGDAASVSDDRDATEAVPRFDNAGPAQYIDRVYLASFRQKLRDLFQPVSNLPHQLFIDAPFISGGASEVQRSLHLAAAHGLTDGLPEFNFLRPQLLRQPLS